MERVALKRNPDYYLRGRPYVDGVELTRGASDPSRPPLAFRAGQVNFLNPGMTAQVAEEIKRAVPATVVDYIPIHHVKTGVGFAFWPRQE
jgi:hypothetical protein